MGDTFFEQIVEQKPTAQKRFLKASIVMAGGLFALMLLPYIFHQMLGTIIFFLAAAIVYYSFYFAKSLDLEHEYVYTNGEIDVDCIIARRKRKRLLTVKLETFEEFSEYKPEKLQGKKFDLTIDASSSLKDEGVYYAIFTGQSGKKCVLFISPNQGLLEEMQKVCKRKMIKS